MKHRIVNDSFWTDSYVEELDPSEKLVFLYMLTNPLCNICGIYEIRSKRIAYETGFDKEVIERILERFVRDRRIMRVDDWVVLVNFAKNQTPNPKVLVGMQRIIDSLPSKVKAMKGFDRLSHFTLLNLTLLNLTLPNGENEKEKEEIIEESVLDSREWTTLEITEIAIAQPAEVVTEWAVWIVLRACASWNSAMASKISTELEYSIESVANEMVDFGEYWLEKTPWAKKCRWEKEKVFDVRRRMKAWLNRAYNGKYWGSNATNARKQAIASITIT